MRSHINKTLLIIISTLLSFNINAQQVDNIIVTDTLKAKIPLKVVYSNTGNFYLAISISENCNQIDKITDKGIEPFVIDTGCISDIIVIGNIVYCTIHSTIKGYNINTGKIEFWMAPTESIGGISSIGDSILVVSDYEWDNLHLINIKTKKDIVTEIDDCFVLHSPCFDKLKNKVYAVDNNPGIIVIDLNNNNSVSRMNINTGSWSGYKGLNVDNYGNIYMSFYGKNGIYLVDTVKKELTKLSDIEPAIISYNSINNSILAADVKSQILYTIKLKQIATNLHSPVNVNLQLSNFQAFPNPSISAFTISFELKKAGKGKITLIDLNGKIVQNIADQNFNSGRNLIECNSSLLRSGTYIIKLEFNNSVFSERIVIN